MRTLPYTAGIVLLSVAPMWLMANDIGGDEVKKTLLGVVGASILGGINALSEKRTES